MADIINRLTNNESDDNEKRGIAISSAISYMQVVNAE